MTMGTASTMACMVEALGVGLPGNAAIPAVDARRNHLARMAGRRIVEMVHEDLVLSKILTREAFENAIRVNGRDRRLHQRGRAPDGDRAAGSASSSTLDDLDRLGRGVPLPRRPDALRPVPDGGFLLRRRAAGGAARARRARAAAQGRADGERPHDLGERAGAPSAGTPRSSRPFDAPFKPEGGMAVLRGNLAPERRGHQAVGGLARADAAHRPRGGVRDHRGPARAASTTTPSTSTPTCIMVLKNCGPKGYPGMAEVGNMPLPPKLLRAGRAGT